VNRKAKIPAGFLLAEDHRDLGAVAYRRRQVNCIIGSLLRRLNCASDSRLQEKLDRVFRQTIGRKEVGLRVQVWAMGAVFA
jgi:hypothetical protein